MAAESVAHGREQIVCKVSLAPGAEPLVEGTGQHRHGHALVDGCLDCPTTFAGVGDAPREFQQLAIAQQGGGGKVEKPRGDNAAAPPDLGDLRQFEIVLVVPTIAQRRSLCVDYIRLLADIGRLEDRETLGIGRHHAVLDAVVHHLDEMTGAAGPAMQVTLLRCSAVPFASWCARDVAATGCQGGEDWVELPNDLGLATNHHTVATLQAPDATAGADVD